MTETRPDPPRRPKPLPNPVDKREPLAPWWWWWIASAFSLAAILALILSVDGIYTDRAQNEAAAAANKARDMQTAAILECFNRYTTDANETSKEQRPLVVAVTAAQNKVAQAQLLDSVADRKVTIAARARGRALDATLRFIVDPARATDPEAEAGRGLFVALIAAQGALIDAESAAVPVERDLTRAYRKYVAANDELERFRAEHPIPDPPSTTCATSD